VHWPSLVEKLSVLGFLAGAASNHTPTKIEPLRPQRSESNGYRPAQGVAVPLSVCAAIDGAVSSEAEHGLFLVLGRKGNGGARIVPSLASEQDRS
jgi:hypothetical protein